MKSQKIEVEPIEYAKLATIVPGFLKAAGGNGRNPRNLFVSGSIANRVAEAQGDFGPCPLA